MRTLQTDLLGTTKFVHREVRKEDVTVVVPVLNEVEAIRTVIQEIRQCGFRKILVIDGHSTDGTVDAATRLGVDVIEQTGTGKTGALATAVQYVVTPFFLVMDGDCTYDPRDIERLLEHAGAYDEVIGARKTGTENIPTINRFGNRVICWVFKVLFAAYLSDVCSGMYLLNTGSARLLQFTTGGFDVEVEIASQIADRGRVTDVPISYRKRVGRQKLSSLRHGLIILTSIIRLANVNNPVVLYSGFMALSIIPALAILAWVAYDALMLGRWHAGYALFGMMLLVLALQALAVAMISLMIKRSEQRISRIMKEKFG